MATSQRSSVRKPESMQFWLGVGVASLALHSIFLFGLQRWARVTIVQPEGGPIAVELVDAPDTVVSQAEPDTIAQVLQKPDAKPAAQPEVAAPEVKLDVKPEVQPEPNIKPEPIVQPSTNADRKRTTPAIVPTPTKPRSQNKPTKSVTPPLKATPEDPKKRPGKKGDSTDTSPVRSNDPLGDPNAVETGERSFLVSYDKPNPMDGPNGRMSAELTFQAIPPISLSSKFARNVGPTINISLTFVVKCPVSQGTVCQTDRLQSEWHAHASLQELNAEQDVELDEAVQKWFQGVKIASLVYRPDDRTAMTNKGDTFWNVQLTLQVKK